MQTVKLFFVSFIILFVCLMPAIAGWITIEITAQVTKVDDPLGVLQKNNIAVNVNDTITGTYIYDSAILDSNPATGVGDYQYYNAPAGMSLNIGGFNFRTDQDNVEFSIRVSNSAYDFGTDYYLFSSYNNLPLADGTVYRMGWQLSDPSKTVLSNDYLPVTAPDLSKWNSNLLQIGIFECPRPYYFFIDAVVTSATLIPEPATLLLLGLGGMMLRKRRS